MGFNLGKSLSGFSRDLGKKTNETFTEGLNRITSGNVGEGGDKIFDWDPGKGTLGHWMDQIYGGSTKQIMEGLQGKGGDDPDDVAPPDLSAYDVDPNAQQQAQMAMRKKDQGRMAANLAQGQGASLLTGQ